MISSKLKRWPKAKSRKWQKGREEWRKIEQWIVRNANKFNPNQANQAAIKPNNQNIIKSQHPTKLFARNKAEVRRGRGVEREDKVRVHCRTKSMSTSNELRRELRTNEVRNLPTDMHRYRAPMHLANNVMINWIVNIDLFAPTLQTTTHCLNIFIYIYKCDSETLEQLFQTYYNASSRQRGVVCKSFKSHINRQLLIMEAVTSG